MKRGRLLSLSSVTAALCLACTPVTSEGPEPGEGDTLDLERMIRQHRYAPYQASELFHDGAVMRRPPEGTVPNDRVTGDPGLTRGVTGAAGGAYVARVPVPVTIELLRYGQGRYEIFCAACHGIAGDGESEVARNMTQRRPPSLVDPRVQAFPPGRVYQVIVEGYGLMRSYEANIPLRERWAIVAYVKALGRSRAAALDALPPPLRERARKELP
ncbi:c-type cytochrome [Sorangium sp. So ce887]|uniref:c-type cytochrome n=1 Tax=Sorangium sp. So ce887 TaxID=3133324 RepID=UPI003F61EE06